MSELGHTGRRALCFENYWPAARTAPRIASSRDELEFEFEFEATPDE